MMNAFVRFIFVLLVIGIAVNLGMVLMANNRSQEHQAANLAIEKKKFAAIVDRFNGRQRRGEFAVEWQKIDSSKKVLESSLLVRIYSYDDKGDPLALPIVRVVIPGDRVNIDGLLLNFGPDFPEKFEGLRNTKLAYFDHVYAPGQNLEDQFTFLKHYDRSTPIPPLATRIDPDRLTHYEMEVWGNIWYFVEDSSNASASSFVATVTPPASITVNDGGVYSFFISNSDGAPTIVESDDPSLLYNIRADAAEQEKEGTLSGTPLEH